MDSVLYKLNDDNFLNETRKILCDQLNENNIIDLVGLKTGNITFGIINENVEVVRDIIDIYFRRYEIKSFEVLKNAKSTLFISNELSNNPSIVELKKIAFSNGITTKPNQNMIFQYYNEKVAKILLNLLNTPEDLIVNKINHEIKQKRKLSFKVF